GARCASRARSGAPDVRTDGLDCVVGGDRSALWYRGAPVSADYGARPAVISVDEWDRVYRRVMLHDVVVGKLQTLPETVRTMADDLAELKATVDDLRDWKEDTKVQRIAGLEKLVDRYEVTERKREAQARRDRRR